ncbi:hypothetical protein FOA52_003327 [Chlamydomonas sp. UWO 241]|nr:hypothetical protein FOA52_003327 [Chlamydomonas sp. UWO 241]
MQPGLAPSLLDDPMDIDSGPPSPGGHQPSVQHAELLPTPGLQDHMDALWSSLGTDDKRALRLCCTAMRDAVDARASSLEEQDDAPLGCIAVLSPTTFARLSGVRTLTLRSMACLRGMVVGTPQPGAAFPRLQSLRLILEEP